MFLFDEIDKILIITTVWINQKHAICKGFNIENEKVLCFNDWKNVS